MIRGVLFDMDGVLVNNTQAHVKAFEIFCERYGVEDWQHKLQTAFGMGNDDIMRLILPEEIIREKGMKALGEEKEAIYREVYAPEIRPVRGLVELLEELRRRGIRCAVGSSGCRENVDFVLSNCGITDYFSCIVSGDRVTRCKPDHTITLQPSIWNGTNPKFSWTIDGQEVGTELSYTYTPTETGIKKIVFTVTDTTDEPEVTLSKCITRTNETRATLEFTVECHGEEESHRRPASGASSATWNRVYEYTPAPGQFINELVSGGFTGTETTPEAAVAYAEKRMRKNTWVSLGGWGGYIVVGFDHSIDNSSSGYKGGYNFSITGNAFKGSSEPGIVYVMQDTNGNTLPDDEWYELKGSEFGKEETVQDYAVTYYRPTYSGADVQWKDNQGVKGKIDYLKQYHDQPSYYPAWIGTDSYTLYGPCLKSRTYDQSGNGSYWVNGEYDWGYADNFGNDRLSEDDNAAAGAMKVYFKISNAVDKNGQPANLKYIDFIRVQTGVNAKAGWLGENSTEVFGFTDENINQGK